MTRFVFQGTGHTVGRSGPVLVILALLMMIGGGGALATAAADLIGVLIVAVAVAFLAAITVAVWLVVRARRSTEPGRGLVRAPVRYELPAPEKPAIAPEQHLHLHFDGTDPAAVAEVLRRHKAE